MRKQRVIWLTIVTAVLIVVLAVAFAIIQNRAPVAGLLTPTVDGESAPPTIVATSTDSSEPAPVTAAMPAVITPTAGSTPTPLLTVMTSTIESEQAALIATGQQLFREQRCTVCHSIGAIGNQRTPLDTVGQRLTAEQIRIWITAPAEANLNLSSRVFDAKQRYQTLPVEQLDALVFYLQSLQGVGE